MNAGHRHRSCLPRQLSGLQEQQDINPTIEERGHLYFPPRIVPSPLLGTSHLNHDVRLIFRYGRWGSACVAIQRLADHESGDSEFSSNVLRFAELMCALPELYSSVLLIGRTI
jgi:hypothetical protein